MGVAVYLLCALTSATCAILLIREYRRSRARLLLWSSIGFAGLALNNGLVFADYVIVPQVDLALVRVCIALISVITLLWGLIWELG